MRKQHKNKINISAFLNTRRTIALKMNKKKLRRDENDDN